MAVRGLGEVIDGSRALRYEVGDAELRGRLHRPCEPLPAQHPHHREEFVIVLRGPAVTAGGL